MLSEKMLALGSKRSIIRETFEYGKARAAQIGAENVFDFSLGNPSVAPPECVNQTIRDLTLNMDPTALHGYTSAQGDAGVRHTIACGLNQRFGTSFHADNLYMTVGAAASLSITIKALCCDGDEFIAPAPFFPEYRVFVETAGGKFVITPPTADLQPDVDAFERALSPATKGVILNSPNNPSGTVFTLETIEKICAVLRRAEERFGHPIYLISDEPYREIVYDGVEVPFLTKHYADTVVCYSFSKSLSLPGERIGYVLVPDEAADSRDLYLAVCGAGRALGYVCAPALFQRVVAATLGETGDISIYARNRDLLYNNLSAMGYDCVRPMGAFYLFVRSPEADANAFCLRARDYELLLVPSDSFGLPGYVRISYCVSTAMIERSLPAFEKLLESYR